MLALLIVRFRIPASTYQKRRCLLRSVPVVVLKDGRQDHQTDLLVTNLGTEHGEIHKNNRDTGGARLAGSCCRRVAAAWA
jgi:hypothetical protein